MPSSLTTASRVWVCVIGSALAWDVFAIRTQKETLSGWCEKHFRTTAVVGTYLMAHLVGRPRALQSVDPLRWVARKLRQPVK